ncbi:hypothetical protein LEP3755_48280 [Leptolyngbya sp. NIES-3755]|nr:hypothetical protein LEP3755_48280 [Leptolyngbya sp. NIES-3755]
MARQARSETLMLEDLFLKSGRSTIVDYQTMKDCVGIDLREKRYLMRSVKRRLWNLHQICVSPVQDKGYYIHG